jgi:hypothetical protein
VADQASVSAAIKVRRTPTRPSRIVRISIPWVTGLPGGPSRQASAAVSVPAHPATRWRDAEQVALVRGRDHEPHRDRFSLGDDSLVRVTSGSAPNQGL